MAIMNAKEAMAFKGQKEKLSAFLEIASTEKQLLASIYSKGLLHKDVKELYHKARSSYENIILNDHEGVGLQEVEYSLWKLHYKHIDEYRKQIRRNNVDKRKSEVSGEDTGDVYMDGFKSFLYEATLFYMDLVRILRKKCGLPEELLLHKKRGKSSSWTGVKFPQCQYACHRFLVCLGDLARYGELCKKGHEGRDWSISAAYYLEASWVWPDSGNPHNQLALLATYIDDPFLALYHCVRSLALKEPFPDAWNNLTLLFEENRSIHIHSLLSEARLDLLKPCEKTFLDATSCESDASSNDNKLKGIASVSSGMSDIWPLFVRLISFFLMKSSLEDFPHTFASVVRRLEALMALSDEELKGALESYTSLDPSEKGPNRALQLVTILIFTVHCLIESQKGHTQKEDGNSGCHLTELALSAIFICVGRIVDRCLTRSGFEECCPLLPLVLVFVEWLVNTLGRAEGHARDERVMSAMAYFFDTFVNLLNRLDLGAEEVAASDNTALWEDHELLGFDPMAHTHAGLDFTGKMGCVWDGKLRSRRIFLAATKIAGMQGDLSHWIVYDTLRKRFSCAQSENHHHVSNSNTTEEEEEVILFEPPIGRRNDTKKGEKSSPLVDHNERESATFSFCPEAPDTSNFYFDNPLRSRGPTDGHPSLKGWVVGGESPHPRFSPEAFNFISLNELGYPIIDSSSSSPCVSIEVLDALPPPPYVSPPPSAPLLPEQGGDGILGAPPMGGYTYATRGPFEYAGGYSPPQGGMMSSAEWLYHHYMNRQEYDRAMWAPHFNAQVNVTNVRRLDGNPLYQWGYPMISTPGTLLYLDSPIVPPGRGDTGRDDKVLFGWQRPEEPALVLQYLKEREVGGFVQPGSQFRGPTFMGN